MASLVVSRGLVGGKNEETKGKTSGEVTLDLLPDMSTILTFFGAN